jgi:hypothetical protein
MISWTDVHYSTGILNGREKKSPGIITGTGFTGSKKKVGFSGTDTTDRQA